MQQRLDDILETLASTSSGKITYLKLARRLGIFSAKLSPLLEQRMQKDFATGRPLLSALVVSSSTGLPSDGFVDAAKRLGFTWQSRGAFIAQQQSDARVFYA